MSLKFKPNDRFEVKSSYDPNFKNKGLIKAVVFNSVHQDWEYVVQWDHISGEHTYECVGAESVWEMIVSDNQDFSTPYVYSNKLDNGSCQHAWKLYEGFVESYEYCTKCDQKKR